MPQHDVTHEQLHRKLETVEDHFNEKHTTLVKWIAATVISVVGVTMTQIVSVSASLSKVDGTQVLVLQQLNRVDRKMEATDLRIQEQSREAAEDLKAHRQELH